VPEATYNTLESFRNLSKGKGSIINFLRKMVGCLHPSSKTM
jgi:hypothetical protein